MKTAMPVQEPPQGAEIWPVSVEAYHALGEARLIPERTELLYGFICHKMSKSPLHSYLLQLLQELLRQLVPTGFFIRTEQPITCVDSEPEPDLAIIKGQPADFRDAHPRTAECVIEICVTSVDYDRSKLRAYANAGVKECWLVLAAQRQIEVYSQPQTNQFTNRSLYGPDGRCVSSTIPQLVVDLRSFFGN